MKVRVQIPRPNICQTLGTQACADAFRNSFTSVLPNLRMDTVTPTNSLNGSIEIGHRSIHDITIYIYEVDIPAFDAAEPKRESTLKRPTAFPSQAEILNAIGRVT